MSARKGGTVLSSVSVSPFQLCCADPAFFYLFNPTTSFCTLPQGKMSGNQSFFFANPDTITFDLWPSSTNLPFCHFLPDWKPPCQQYDSHLSAPSRRRNGFFLVFPRFLAAWSRAIGGGAAVHFLWQVFLIWFLPIFGRQKYCGHLFTNDYWWTWI